jgi:hypothetical protein
VSESLSALESRLRLQPEPELRASSKSSSNSQLVRLLLPLLLLLAMALAEPESSLEASLPRSCEPLAEFVRECPAASRRPFQSPRGRLLGSGGDWVRIEGGRGGNGDGRRRGDAVVVVVVDGGGERAKGRAGREL